MCHYNVLKCIRCRKLHRNGYDLCTRMEQGTICVADHKLKNGAVDQNEVGTKAHSTMAMNGIGSDRKSSASPIDLYYILPHEYTYTDGCLDCP